MLQTPEVAGLILCEQMAVVPGQGRMSLEGVFHARRFSEFPTDPQAFTVYAALTDGVGRRTLKLTVTRLETNGIIYSYRRAFAFPPDRLDHVNLEVRVKSCVFPAPGRYAVTLSFDDEAASERTLRIVEE
jgi:hypothetical protein